MKIGILSMQRIHNAGSFLQAFSLKKILEAEGHDVYFIDIEKGINLYTEIHENKVNDRIIYYLKKIDKQVFQRLKYYIFFNRMKKLYTNFLLQNLHLDKKLPNDMRYDLIIIGSDEVFNCTQQSAWGFTTQLFGEGLNANKVITYAASCGHSTYKQVYDMDLCDRISKAMSNLFAVSVRDNNTKEFVEKLWNGDVNEHLDPVFLFNYDQYIPICKFEKPFVLVYAYSGRIKDEKEIKNIKDFANRNGLEVVSVGQYQKWCRYNIIANPFELLSFVKKASFVITDTFHGTVFSIKYNKRFCTIVRESNKQKIIDLLKRFKLDLRLVKNINDLGAILIEPIDYTNINKYIHNQIIKSCHYLNIGINNYTLEIRLGQR